MGTAMLPPGRTLAFRLCRSQTGNGDAAYPTLIREILPGGPRGIIFAALFGAVYAIFW